MQHRYTDAHLRGEIQQYMLGLQDRREPLRPLWIAQAICLSHREGLALDDDSDHVAFWQYTGYTITRKFATECINRYETGLDAASTQQQRFPGFEAEYLQDYYVVTRNGEDLGIQIEDCTDDELLAKALMFRANSRKLLAHAHELERFIDWRREHMRSAS